MSQARRLIYTNKYFLVPFALWVVVGALLLNYEDEKDIFLFANSHHNHIFDYVMVGITWMGEAATIIVVLASLMTIKSFQNNFYFTTAALCNLLPAGVSQWIKGTITAPRPMGFYNSAAWIHIEPFWPLLLQNSFPSGHSTGAFSFFFFLSLMLPRRRKFFGFIFFLLALSVCYSRMYLAAHFFVDVYAGSIIGVVFCYLVYYSLYKYKRKLFRSEN